jgi:hypothetical protein
MADWCVAALGVVVIVTAGWFALRGMKIDGSILTLAGVGLVLAAWPVLSIRLSKLSVGPTGISIELSDRVAAVESKMASTQTAFSTLSHSEVKRDARLARRIPGAGTFAEASTTLLDTEKVEAPADDPLAGEFGGRATRGDRILTAEVRPYPAVPEWGLINLTVAPTLGGRPIDTPVTFHLHPSFAPNDIQTLSPGSSGSVSLQVISYGAFTVGVETDAGSTQLEFNLASAPGAFSPWKER